MTEKLIYIEKLDTPNLNGHIYTKECIEKAIINNKDVQELLANNMCFLYGKPQDDIYSLNTSDIIGIVKSFSINEDSLYASMEINKDVIPTRAYLCGKGSINSNTSNIEDYEFCCVFTDEKEKDNEEKSNN